ncbi:hypothetical protein [Ramlibacter sp.]|uniref:hypothetical protein n=1 Tax=Ramlibacter sp. TaxID=1917967 RepID=UPI00184C10B8|nr:hypothetical protein [Ramlibacter sp.]MBA2674691.1 hypothetical protein [Ramlibacter sp.]
MKRTLVAFGCAFALLGGTQAQQQPGGGSLADKAKQAAQTLGEKTREAAEKVKNATQNAKATADQKTTESGGDGGGPETQRMQRQADANYKSASARCRPIEQRAQKTLCEKQATAAHANAEVAIAKANLRARGQGGNTATMGAGKSSSR